MLSFGFRQTIDHLCGDRYGVLADLIVAKYLHLATEQLHNAAISNRQHAAAMSVWSKPDFGQDVKIVRAAGDAMRAGVWESEYSRWQEDLFSIDFVSPERGWIVGARGVVLHTEDGGQRGTPPKLQPQNAQNPIDDGDIPRAVPPDKKPVRP